MMHITTSLDRDSSTVVNVSYWTHIADETVAKLLDRKRLKVDVGGKLRDVQIFTSGNHPPHNCRAYTTFNSGTPHDQIQAASDAVERAVLAEVAKYEAVASYWNTRVDALQGWIVKEDTRQNEHWNARLESFVKSLNELNVKVCALENNGGQVQAVAAEKNVYESAAPYATQSMALLQACLNAHRHLSQGEPDVDAALKVLGDAINPWQK